MIIQFEPTGIKRKIDDLGRIVLPLDYRQKLKIKSGEEFEIFADKNGNFYLKRGKK